MTRLFQEAYIMPAASMGRDNPLPDIKSLEDQHAAAKVDRTSVSQEEARYMGWGRVKGILPYTIQDGYNRRRRPRAFQAMVLENDHLRATFLPELGGRLWSLIDRNTGRELLHRNPVFQPCNLALRNAWFSGGVEWNVGIIGHSPFTAEPLFVRQKTLKDGTPALSMYQYERVRGLCYRVEAMLPEDSRFLYVRVRIDNCKPQDTAVYWWSNIAVDERQDTRVIVPAEKAFHWGSDAGVHKVEVPDWEGHDVSRPQSLPYAMDFFFDIQAGRRRFIASPGGDGYGLVQCSTDQLRGRKLFVWGQGAGGRRWQAFLSRPGSAYIEIQAGLARTQLEHLPMQAGQTISWTEAYGPLQSDPDQLNKPDWAANVRAVEQRLEQALPRKQLELYHQQHAKELDSEDGWTQLSLASGWARLEQELLGDGFQTAGLAFPLHSLGQQQQPWMQLIRRGYLPSPSPLKPPTSYQTGEAWTELVQASIHVNPKAQHWYSYYQLGVMLHHGGRHDAAKEAFQTANQLSPSPWATWCLAILSEQEGDFPQAADHAMAALQLLPHRAIVAEALRLLLKAGQYARLIQAYDALPQALQNPGRHKALLIAACLHEGDLARARKVLLGPLVQADIREGEAGLSALWFELRGRELAQERNEAYDPSHLQEARARFRPLARLDYRMKE